MRQTGWIAIAVVLLIAVVFAISQTLTITLLSSPSTTSTTGTVSGMELISNELTLIRGCSDGQLLKFSAGTGLWACNEDVSTAATGDAVVTLDLEYDGTLESTSLATIATTGAGATTIFTEPEPDVLLIDTDVAWPTTASHASSHADGGADPLFQTKTFVWVDATALATGSAVEDIHAYFEWAAEVQSARCSVGTAPTGSSIIVQFTINSSQGFASRDIFASGDRPTIAVGINTDRSTTIAESDIPVGDFVTITYDQLDSNNVAANLTCQLETRIAVYDTN